MGGHGGYQRLKFGPSFGLPGAEPHSDRLELRSVWDENPV